MYLLQSYPSSYPDHRRSALGYIMEGKEGDVEKAVNIIKKEKNLSSWHEIVNAKFDISTLNTVFDKYTTEAAK